MKRCHYSLILICLLLSMPNSIAWSQTSSSDEKTVVAWGETAVTKDAAADKRLALSHARRNALEQVVGSYVTAESKVKNFQLVEDRIYSKSTGFIDAYRTLQEKRDQVQRVQIEARVSLLPVTEVLRDSGMLRKWRIGIVLTPIQDERYLNHIYRYYSQVRLMEVIGNIEAAIGNEMVRAGFKLVDSSHVAKIRTGLATSEQLPDKMLSGIDILVSGPVTLATRPSSGDMRQAICQIHAKALRADTGEIVYQGNIGNTFDGVTLLVERDVAMRYAATLANGLLADGEPDLRTFGMGDTAALDKAVSLSSKMAADIIVSQVMRIPAAGSATISLEIHGIDFGQLMQIEAQLQGTEGVSSAVSEEFTEGDQTIAVEYDGDAMMLARTLNKSALMKEIGLKVKNVTKSKIVLTN